MCKNIRIFTNIIRALFLKKTVDKRHLSLVSFFEKKVPMGEKNLHL
uniref:Uncharacterized protein n=1 Tax=Klebsiella pneumoniae TaxID=573 RepID=A0A8B0SU39_KLEPN|nr:hypothetical protein [Klebsiella pneumoniae]